MKVLGLIPAGFISIFGILSPILDWIFKDKSLEDISIENSISEVEDKYKEALKSIREGKEEKVEIDLENGEKLIVKSIK